MAAEDKGKGKGAKEEEQKAEPKKNNLVIIIVAAVLVVLIIVGVVIVLLLGGDDKAAAQPAPAAAPQAAAAPQPAEAKGGGTKRTADKVYTSVGPMQALKTLTVNLLTTDNSKKYLRATISLELADPKAAPGLAGEVTTKESAIRDIIIGILTSKTFEEISTSKGKERLKDEIVETINQSLVDGQIKNIFFTEFIVQ